MTSIKTIEIHAKQFKFMESHHNLCKTIEIYARKNEIYAKTIDIYAKPIEIYTKSLKSIKKIIEIYTTLWTNRGP